MTTSLAKVLYVVSTQDVGKNHRPILKGRENIASRAVITIYSFILIFFLSFSVLSFKHQLIKVLKIYVFSYYTYYNLSWDTKSSYTNHMCAAIAYTYLSWNINGLMESSNFLAQLHKTLKLMWFIYKTPIQTIASSGNNCRVKYFNLIFLLCMGGQTKTIPPSM